MEEGIKNIEEGNIKKIVVEGIKKLRENIKIVVEGIKKLREILKLWRREKN